MSIHDRRILSQSKVPNCFVICLPLRCHLVGLQHHLLKTATPPPLLCLTQFLPPALQLRHLLLVRLRLHTAKLVLQIHVWSIVVSADAVVSLALLTPSPACTTKKPHPAMLAIKSVVGRPRTPATIVVEALSLVHWFQTHAPMAPQLLTFSIAVSSAYYHQSRTEVCGLPSMT